MAIKLSEIYLTPGRLLVEPIEKSRQDIFEVSESGREISAANVVKVGRLDAEFEGLVPGAAIIYERLNSEALTLQDEEGKDKVYRFVLVRDVAGWVPPVGWVEKPKLPSIKELIDSRPEYDPIKALRNKERNTNPTAEQIALWAALKDRETLKDHKYDGMTWVGKLTIPENPTDEQKAAYVRAINFGQLSEGSILPENEFKEKFPSLPPDNITLGVRSSQTIGDAIENDPNVMLAKHKAALALWSKRKGDQEMKQDDEMRDRLNEVLEPHKQEIRNNVEDILDGLPVVIGYDPIDPVFSMKVFEDDAKKMAADRKSILETSKEMERDRIEQNPFTDVMCYFESLAKECEIDFEQLNASILFQLAPKGINYFAISELGRAAFYEFEPFFDQENKRWVPESYGKAVNIVIQNCNDLRFNIDDNGKSLLKRP